MSYINEQRQIILNYVLGLSPNEFPVCFTFDNAQKDANHFRKMLQVRNRIDIGISVEKDTGLVWFRLR